MNSHCFMPDQSWYYQLHPHLWYSKPISFGWKAPKTVFKKLLSSWKKHVTICIFVTWFKHVYTTLLDLPSHHNLYTMVFKVISIFYHEHLPSKFTIERSMVISPSAMVHGAMLQRAPTPPCLPRTWPKQAPGIDLGRLGAVFSWKNMVDWTNREKMVVCI